MPPTKSTLLIVLTLASQLLLGGLAVSASAAEGEDPPPPHRCDAECKADLERARTATEKYRDVTVAMADGFVPVSPCEPDQGIHYANFARLNTPEVDVRYPEVLLYLPEAGNGRRLVGIEHVKSDDDQNLDTDDDRPSLYGQPFTGPMIGHDEPLHLTPKHFELHVWLYSDHSKSGIFAQHNSSLSCPEG